MGIDYGGGVTNIDTETGIRYGVIHQNYVDAEALNNMLMSGEDLGWIESFNDMKEKISNAIMEAIDIGPRSYRYERLKGICDDTAQAFLDEEAGELATDREQGTTVYESDGLVTKWHPDGYIFVLKSPVLALRNYCSPCMPGAGDLKSDGNVPTYCLPEDWFDEYSPMPYEPILVSDYLSPGYGDDQLEQIEKESKHEAN
jgi:hypothetical protein